MTKSNPSAGRTRPLVCGCLAVSEAMYMTVELLASRFVSPVIGTSLTAWTCVLAVILGASAVGNWVGGRLVTRGGRDWILLALCVEAVAVAVAGVVSPTNTLAVVNSDLAFVRVVMAVVLVAVATVCAGALSPLFMAEVRGEGERAPSALFACMTLGGLAGTVAAGFWLIPMLGASMLSLVVGGVCVAVAGVWHLFGYGVRKWPSVRPVACMLLALGTVVGSQALARQAMAGFGDGVRPLYSCESNYNHIEVYQGAYLGEPVDYLLVDGGFESAAYRSRERRHDLVFSYTKKYFDTLSELGINEGACLMMGGGAYSVPRHVLRNTDMSCDVVEIDPEVTRVAYERFDLQDAIDWAGAERFGNFNEDARTYLNREPRKYSVILSDLYSGICPPRQVTTVEAMRHVHDMLEPGGVYMANVISDTSGERGELIKHVLATLDEVFESVLVLPVDSRGGFDNYVVVASDGDLGGLDAIEVPHGGYRPLTDDWCPVEYLTRDFG